VSRELTMLTRRTILAGAFAMALTANCSEAKKMSTGTATLSVEQLMARIKQGRMTIPDLPREAVTGYPVPLVIDGLLALGVPLFLRRGLPPAPPQVAAPGWIAYIDVRTGEQFTYRKLDFDPGKLIGPHQIEPKLGMDEFLAAEARMYQAMDHLLPLAMQGQPGIPPALAGEAEVFARIWRHIAHKPIQPYYHQINPAWFARFGL
jgi:hypothetical protein